MNLIAIPSGMETGYFVQSAGALADVPELLKKAFPGKTPLLIADGYTWKAAGQAVEEHLKRAGMAMRPPILLPAEPHPHPDYDLSLRLAKEFTPETVPVAVGAGVVNDLVKCAAGSAGIQYCCVATAASVDGYTSYGAAMSVGGMKKTIPCPAPYALVADLEVLKKAPPEMFASGYADLLAKIYAGADWIIADQMHQDLIRPPIWNLVQKNLRKVCDNADLNGVFMGLAATGYAMQLDRDSRPASGAEHMLSHIWEMEGLELHGEPVSHGFKVGIGLTVSVQLMEFVMNTPAAEAEKMAIAPLSRLEREKEIDALLAKGCYGTGNPATARSKFLEGDAILQRRKQIYQNWACIAERIKPQLYTYEETIHHLRAVGAPAHYSEIGLDRAQYLHGIRAAQLIRNRYTILDLLYEGGVLEAAIAQIRN